MHFPSLTKSLKQLLGPSVLFVALSISGGEMLLWPELISKYGLLLIWIVPIILFLQYSVNIEIERYTLATGSNTLTKLASFSTVVGWIVALSVVISLLWPAWVTTSGNMLALLLGLSEYKTLISIGLLGIILLLWSNKNSYQIMEAGAKIGMAIVLFISFGIVVYLLAIKRLPLELGTKWIPPQSDAFSYVAALAFGGVTGVLNLVQSDWIESRKYGATGIASPEKIEWESPITKLNWQAWWKAIKTEHAVLFYAGNVIGIILIGLVASLTLRDFNGSGFSLLTHQVEFLNSLLPGLGIAWGIGTVLLFFMAQVTILDAAGKLLKRSEFGPIKRLSAARLSQLTGVLGVIVLVVGLVIPTFSQPSYLLKLSAVVSAAVMALYPIALIRINNQLPEIARPNVLARFGTIACSIFYGNVVIWMIGTFL